MSGMIYVGRESANFYGTGIYQMRCTAHKVAPEDGLIQVFQKVLYNFESL